MREDMRAEAKATVEGYLVECEKYKDMLERSFSHVAIIWIHRALRVFVESTLLYGIPPCFAKFLVKASPKNIGKIHANLKKVFGNGMSADDDDQPVGDENEYHSYISFPISLASLGPLSKK